MVCARSRGAAVSRVSWSEMSFEQSEMVLQIVSARRRSRVPLIGARHLERARVSTRSLVRAICGIYFLRAGPLSPRENNADRYRQMASTIAK